MDDTKKAVVAVYLDPIELTWLNEKVKLGYKASSFMRNLIRQAMAREAKDVVAPV